MFISLSVIGLLFSLTGRAHSESIPVYEVPYKESDGTFYWAPRGYTPWYAPDGSYCWQWSTIRWKDIEDRATLVGYIEEEDFYVCGQ